MWKPARNIWTTQLAARKMEKSLRPHWFRPPVVAHHVFQTIKNRPTHISANNVDWKRNPSHIQSSWQSVILGSIYFQLITGDCGQDMFTPSPPSAPTSPPHKPHIHSRSHWWRPDQGAMWSPNTHTRYILLLYCTTALYHTIHRKSILLHPPHQLIAPESNRAIKHCFHCQVLCLGCRRGRF